MVNSSANFPGCQPQLMHSFIPIFLSFIFFIGFVMNCISLWIFWFRVKQWNSTVIIQFNLAIADVTITPAAPLVIIYSLTDHWTFRTFFCQFKVFLLSTHMYGSIYFLTLMSIHRYFSVVHNNKKKAVYHKAFHHSLVWSYVAITPAAPLIIIYSLTDQWTFGTFCQFKVFLLNAHMYGSIYFLTLMSIHRYFSVALNVKRKALTTKPFIAKLSIIVWSCLLVQGIPFFFVLKTSKVHGVTKCLSIHQSDQAVLFFVWNWVVLFSGLLNPFTSTLVCYSLLSRYILKINPLNNLTNVTVNKSVQTISVSLIIFIICYILVHITRTMVVTITLFFPSKCSLLENVEVAYYITWMLSGTNFCLDPILYCYASERFKHTFTSWCSHLIKRVKDQNMTLGNTQSNQVESAPEQHRPLPTVSTSDTGFSLSTGADK